MLKREKSVISQDGGVGMTEHAEKPALVLRINLLRWEIVDSCSRDFVGVVRRDHTESSTKTRFIQTPDKGFTACQTIARIVLSNGAEPNRSPRSCPTASISLFGSTPRSAASVPTGLPRTRPVAKSLADFERHGFDSEKDSIFVNCVSSKSSRTNFESCRLNGIS